MKKIVVQKFGGTSLGHADRLSSLVGIVKSHLSTNFPILVVSAISGKTKSQGTTSLLLSAIRSASEGEGFEAQLISIISQHRAVLEGVISGKSSPILGVIEEEISKVRRFLSAIQIIREASPRSVDYILSVGERLSSILVSEVLRQSGIESIPVDLTNVLSGEQVLETDELYERSAKAFKEKLLSETSLDDKFKVPVVTGFFGSLPNGMLDTIGRGYTDLTAALIARGFGKDLVKEVQIWKEVDGVFSADPRRVENAKVLKRVSPLEASELTYFGSEVIHPYTMEQVISAGMPIRVLNSLRPELEGTIIEDASHVLKGVPTAVTVKTGVSVLSITSNRMFDARGFLARLFTVLKDHNVVVDLVSTSEITVSSTIDDLAALKRALPKLSEFGEVEVLEDRAILAVVGEGLKGNTKIISRMLSALGDNGIDIDLLTQATSQVSISCVMRESDVERGVVMVHDELFQR